jgi:hypothetical protein
LLYVFQGITDDGQFYVSFTAPITSPILEDEIVGTVEPDFGDTLEAYRADLTVQLNAQAAADFTPDLSLLDALITSLKIASPATDAVQISWEDARNLILEGQVTMAAQSHSLDVQLQLADGSTVTTQEPAIDEIFKVIQECGDPCSSILIATE